MLSGNRLHKINILPGNVMDGRFNFLQTHTKKLFSSINQISPFTIEKLMERTLKRRGILTMNHCMYIKQKWNRSTTEFINPIQRV